MWWWVLLFAVLGSCGAALLGFLAWRLYGKVRQLGRAVATASERLSALTVELEKATARSNPNGSGPDAASLTRLPAEGRAGRTRRTM